MTFPLTHSQCICVRSWFKLKKTCIHQHKGNKIHIYIAAWIHTYTYIYIYLPCAIEYLEFWNSSGHRSHPRYGRTHRRSLCAPRASEEFGFGSDLPLWFGGWFQRLEYHAAQNDGNKWNYYSTLKNRDWKVPFAKASWQVLHLYFDWAVFVFPSWPDGRPAAPCNCIYLPLKE